MTHSGAGADTTAITQLLTYLHNGVPVQQALQQLQLPRAICDFVGYTLEVIEKAPVHVQAAVFTFVHEDLIPDMFMGLVKDLSVQYPTQLAVFKYYLERHIEVDGDHHSHLAMEMVDELCGEDDLKWEQATEAAEQVDTNRALIRALTQPAETKEDTESIEVYDPEVGGWVQRRVETKGLER